MSQAKFYQAVLVPLEPEQVIASVYPQRVASQITLEERLPDCKCQSCGGKEWIILPKESSLVREGGKPYIECIKCGNFTHL